MLPNIPRRLRILRIISESLVIATPATISLKPERYLVAEYRQMSAPSCSGCWNAGPRNVLSTMITGRSGFLDAVSAARSISVMMSVGLAGVSRYTMQQFSAERMACVDRRRIARRHRNPAHSERLEEGVDQAGGAAVERSGIHDGAVGPREREECGHDRRHARIENRGLPSTRLQRHDLVLQDLRIRMRESRIDQVGPFALGGLDLPGRDGKGMLGGFRAGKNVGRTAEYRRPRRTERQAGVEAPASVPPSADGRRDDRESPFEPPVPSVAPGLAIAHIAYSGALCEIFVDSEDISAYTCYNEPVVSTERNSTYGRIGIFAPTRDRIS